MGICCHRMEVTRGVTFKHRKQCAATAIFIMVVCSTFWADGNPINRTSANRFNFDDGQGENTMDVGSVLKAVVHIAPLKYLWPRNSTEELARCITQEKAIRMRATLGQTARNTSPCSAPPLRNVELRSKKTAGTGPAVFDLQQTRRFTQQASRLRKAAKHPLRYPPQQAFLRRGWPAGGRLRARQLPALPCPCGQGGKPSRYRPESDGPR